MKKGIRKKDKKFLVMCCTTGDQSEQDDKIFRGHFFTYKKMLK